MNWSMKSAVESKNGECIHTTFEDNIEILDCTLILILVGQ